MSFSARLSQDFVPVEAGARVTVEIEIANRSEVQDQFELVIEGLDPEWIANPVPTFPVEPTETFSQKVHFKPPRQSESLAGDYPFVATVRSLNTGESRQAQGVLQILPFHYLSLEISPKKGKVSPTNRRDEFEIAVLNMGNIEQTVQLAGTDPDNALSYEPGENPISVGPGQQKSVPFVIGPRKARFLGSGQIFGFTITARGNDTGTVVASAQGQLEQRPLITPGSFIGLLLLGILAAAWAALIPKPPTFKMGIDPMVITLGQSIKIDWSSTNAQNVFIKANSDEIVINGHPSDSKIYTPLRPGIWTFEGSAFRDSTHESPHQVVTVTVNEPPKVDDPKVDKFSIEPTKVKVGDPFVIHYELSPSVTRAVLGPTNEDLNLNLHELEQSRQTAGTFEFTIVAENSLGKTDTKKAKVVVFAASKAVIIAFTTAAAEIDSTVGHVSLSWQTNNAVRAEVAAGDQVTTLDKDRIAEGTMDFPVTKTTTFTLTVFDDQGLTLKKTVTVKVVPPKQPINPPIDQGGSAGAAGPTTAGGPHG